MSGDRRSVTRRTRGVVAAVGVTLGLAACGKHPTGRYEAVAVPSSISHRINAHGIRVAKAAKGQPWLLMHADGSSDPVSGLPDDAQVTGINDIPDLFLAAKNTRLHELVGTTKVGWRDGMARMVAARHPELYPA